MVSGVFRYGRLDLVADVSVPLHVDGKTASVSLVDFPNGITAILTNGKTDAAIQMRPGQPVTS
jgi:spermidine synthase